MRAGIAAQNHSSAEADRGKDRKLLAWRPSQELDIGQWAAAGRRIGMVGRCVQWLLGDWIAYGNSKFGEKYSRAAEITGYDPQSLMNMVYVASRFQISRRRENLSWSHHEAIASLEADDQEHWLDLALEHSWSVADLRMMLRSARRKKDGEDETTNALGGGVGNGDAAVAGAASRSTSAESSELTREVDQLTAERSGLIRCPRCGEDVPVIS